MIDGGLDIRDLKTLRHLRDHKNLYVIIEKTELPESDGLQELLKDLKDGNGDGRSARFVGEDKSRIYLEFHPVGIDHKNKIDHSSSGYFGEFLRVLDRYAPGIGVRVSVGRPVGFPED